MRIAILITFLISIALFQNCGSSSGGQGFNLNTAASSASGGAPLTVTSPYLVATAVGTGVSISPTSSISGGNPNGVSCTWTIVNSANQPVVASVVGTYMSAGSTCSGSLVTPTTAGQYGIVVSVTDASGDQASNLITIQVGTPSTPTPTPPPTGTPPPAPSPTPPPTGSGQWNIIGTAQSGGVSCSTYLGYACSPTGAIVDCYEVVAYNYAAYVELQCQ